MSVSSNNYFNCAVSSCPFCVLLRPVFVSGVKKYEFVKFVCSQHCHEPNGKSRKENRAMVKEEIKMIRDGQDVGGLLKKKHEKWQEDAIKAGHERKEKLMEEEKAINHACEHPDKTGKQVEKSSKTS